MGRGEWVGKDRARGDQDRRGRTRCGGPRRARKDRGEGPGEGGQHGWGGDTGEEGPMGALCTGFTLVYLKGIKNMYSIGFSFGT
jgi:hypothetical protein